MHDRIFAPLAKRDSQWKNRKQRVHGSGAPTFGFLGGALILFVVSILLFATIVEGPITVGLALILAVAAVALLFMALAVLANPVVPSAISPLVA